MSVKKIFWEDPYLTCLEAQINGVDGGVVTLDRTIIYALSGGQQSDSGLIGPYEVLKAQKEGLEIFYTLDQDHRLKTGDKVRLTIDWEKRYRLMKLHFAAELVLELVYQNYGRPEKIGANITADKSRVDFYWSGSIAEIFPELNRRLRELIEADLPIISAFNDQAQERRYWEIAGLAKVPCGGTHLKATGEIGSVKLKRNNLGQGKERIEIVLLTA